MSRVVAIGVVALLLGCGQVADGGGEPARASSGGKAENGGAPGFGGSGGRFPTIGDDDACHGVELSDHRPQVDSYILMDASQSMGELVAGVGESWWTEIGAALADYTLDPRSAYTEAGIQFFPGAEDLSQACSFDDYEVPAVAPGQLPQLGPALVKAFSSRSPAGPNTSGPAFAASLAYLRAQASLRLGRLSAVVLVVGDTVSACEPMDLVELARDAFETDPRVATFVIGLGAADRLAHLDAIASAGGTERAFNLAGPGVRAGFIDAMLRVQDTIDTCEFSVPSEDGEDPEGVSVRLTPLVGSRQETLLPRLADRAACDAAGSEGWYADYGTNPFTIVLCRESCIQKRSGKLTFMFNCPNVP